MEKKEKILSAFLFAASALCIFSAATLFGIAAFEEYVGIVIGVAMMLLAVFFHNLTKIFCGVSKRSKAPYYISYFLNTVACGFSASSYYVTCKINAELGEIFAAVLIAVIFLFFCAVIFFFTSKKFTAVCVVFCMLDTLVAAFAVGGWASEGNAFFSFLFFSCVMAFFYIFAIRTAAKKYIRSPIVRTVSLHSFGIFILITFIVLVILSEGDGLDGLDGFDFGGNTDSKKKKSQISDANAENLEADFKRENPEYFE